MSEPKKRVLKIRAIARPVLVLLGAAVVLFGCSRDRSATCVGNGTWIALLAAACWRFQVELAGKSIADGFLFSSKQILWTEKLRAEIKTYGQHHGYIVHVYPSLEISLGHLTSQDKQALQDIENYKERNLRAVTSYRHIPIHDATKSELMGWVSCIVLTLLFGAMFGLVGLFVAGMSVLHSYLGIPGQLWSMTTGLFMACIVFFPAFRSKSERQLSPIASIPGTNPAPASVDLCHVGALDSPEA